MILVFIGISIVFWVDLCNSYVWFVLFVLFGYGIVGFVDDYWKIKCKNIDGLIFCWKYFWLFVIVLVVILGIYVIGKDIIVI